MKALLRHPLFLAGLALRLLLIAGVTAEPVRTWYAPFLAASLGDAGLDPWSDWLAQGGTPLAFPYGYMMWLAFLPATLLCTLAGAPLAWGYGATLLVADVLLLRVLLRLAGPGQRLLLPLYWLSPIVLVASYLLGFNDLVPVLLLAVALLCVQQRQLVGAGLAMAAAVSAKLSMVLALPFFGVYLLQNRALRQRFLQFAAGLAAGALLLLLPFVFSAAGMQMLFSNPEMGKIYQLALDLGYGTVIYLVPLAYLLMLYATWRVRRLNFDLFHAMLGLAFLLVVLMTPASPGWFIWALPLLVIYQAAYGSVALLLGAGFSLLYVLSALVNDRFGLLAGPLAAWGVADLGTLRDGRLGSLLHTVMVATGIVLAVRMWRDTVSRNDFFRLSRKPFVIGVAGDSGAGKDTFTDAIAGLFGTHSVTRLSGDDYHLWDRQKPMWQVMTHLNPMANDLERFATDLVALADGRAVQIRHYDHETGRMSRQRTLKSNDFILSSGLHALYLPMLREACNLSIYLDIDEDLRRHFKLQRDVHVRGHSAERVLSSFDKRAPDAERFIRPQATHADLVLSLQPIHPRMLEAAGNGQPLRFKLVARARPGLNELSLNRVLVGVCGLHVDMTTHAESGDVVMTIEGETSAQDVQLAAQMICPRLVDFLDLEPAWQDGMLGLMQLITLSHINQALTKRFIW